MAVSKSVQPKRKVTMAEIAQIAQVSKTTVSFVLNNKVSFVLNNRSSAIKITEATQQRVLEAAKNLGYRRNAAAKALITGRSYTVLVVSFNAWHDSFVERLRGAEVYLSPLGYSLRFCTVGAEGGLASCVEILGSGQADGVLLAGAVTAENYSVFHDLCGEADETGIPVVALADGFPRDVVKMVANIQEEQGGEDAVTHLIEHGHKRILFVGVPGAHYTKTRGHGYRSALTKAGIPVDPRLIINGVGGAWAYETTRQLVHSLDFTAVFAVGDRLAIQVISALSDEGIRVPEDCAVIGFNNEDIAQFTRPPLTTVRNPFFDTGRAAAEILVNLIEGRSAENVCLPVSLVIRRSCGCK